MNDKPPIFNLTQEDQELWQRYMGVEAEDDDVNEDFATMLEAFEGPFQDDAFPSDPPKDTTSKEYSKSDAVESERKKNIDGHFDKKLKQGKIPIERIYDLHGLKQAQAFAALEKFVQKSYQEKCRCVLVITGKGKSTKESNNWFESSKGVLKEKLPQWLSASQFNKMILKITPAHAKHGGDGAFYIYLRKNDKM